MAVKKTTQTMVHITQPGSKGQGTAHYGDDITKATTTMRGTVKQTPYLATIGSPGTATTTDIATRLNDLITALRNAEIIKPTA